MPSLLQKPWFAESIQCWVGYPQHVSGAVLLPFSLSVHIFFKLFFTFISFQISVLYIYILTDIDLWYFGLIYICLIVLIYWLNWLKRYLQEFYMHCESNDLQDLSPKVIWYNMIEISYLMCYILQDLSPGVFWYYMIEISFYWSLMFSQFMDVKRKVRLQSREVNLVRSLQGKIKLSLHITLWSTRFWLALENNKFFLFNIGF